MLENRLATLYLLQQTNFGTGQIEEYERNIQEIEDIKKQIEDIEIELSSQ